MLFYAKEYTMATDSCLATLVRRDWLLISPLADRVGPYIAALRRERYGERTICAYLGGLAHFCYWMRSESISWARPAASFACLPLSAPVLPIDCQCGCCACGTCSGCFGRRSLDRRRSRIHLLRSCSTLVRISPIPAGWHLPPATIASATSTASSPGKTSLKGRCYRK